MLKSVVRGYSVTSWLAMVACTHAQVVGVVVGIAASIKLGLLNFRFKEIDNKHVGLLSASQTHLRAAAAAASILPAL